MCFDFSLYSRAAWAGGGGGRCQTFFFLFSSCSADHERDWPPCKVLVFIGLATNALNVRNNNNNNNNVPYRPTNNVTMSLIFKEKSEST